MVQVHCGEGVANHTGPEPCVFGREAEGEAEIGAVKEQHKAKRIVWPKLE